MAAPHPRSADLARRLLGVAAAALLAAGCLADEPPQPATASPTPTPTSIPTSPSTPPPTEPPGTPSRGATPATAEVPLAVVTGFTSLRPSITLAELESTAAAGQLLVPCGLSEPSFTAELDPGACTPADAIVAAVQADPARVALLPAGLVEPAVKVLPVDGADLFGSAEARGRDYPVVADAIGLPAEWTAHDPTEIRTLTSVGESCPDRGVAHAAITLGRGWEWVLGGGTAEYTAIYPNPAGPGQVGNGFDIVAAVQTGNEGAVWRLIGSADATIEDFECPVVNDFTVNEGVIFSIDPRIPPLLAERGTDVVTLAANHLTDQGIDGLLETLDHFDSAGILRTGAGANLAEALTPAVFDADGLRFAVVGWNLVPGAADAGPTSPGVAPMTEENIRSSVADAHASGDVVICMPQWGYPEYRAEFTPEELALQALFFDAGCDHVMGHGTHWASAVDFTRRADGGIGFTILSHGNFLFGQGWSQQTQEGVIPELTFRGTELVQLRLHPYVMIDQAQANLTDPQTDGRYVLERVFGASDETY